MTPSRSIFSIYFQTASLPVAEIWDTLVSFLKSENCLPREFKLSQIAGHSPETRSERDLTLETERVRQCIIARKLNAFSVSCGKGDAIAHYRLLPAGGEGSVAILTTTLKTESQAPVDWATLIEEMMIRWPGMIGRQWNVGYAAWQNAENLPTYETNYGPIPPGFFFKAIPSDGISPSRQVLDISKNPGRYKAIAPGLYFSPSSEMWLGSHFWQFSKCSKEEVLAADFLLEVRDTPYFLYLKSWPQPFTRPDGEQGRVQQKLWQLLFHEDCEWPPGSGGISDEPVYGPPALMSGNPEVS